ncbi:Probable methylmalonyl-CoA mutase small subunit MutA [Mycobacteroides abscessus]|nr:Probable methylmalonyl-CoA mutase small subunit MutA [Mycobacteroides abscessus]
MTVEVPEIRRDFARWQKGVAGVLAKSTRKAVEDLPADPERLLDSPTYDGIAIRPLYTALDELPEPSLPGQWPFVRGGDPRRDVNSGWKVAEVFGGAADPALVNEAILDALGQGASAIVLAGLPPEAVARALQGVYLDLAPVQLEAGAELTAVAEALLTTLDAYEGDAAAVVADLGADPLGNAFADRAGISIDETVALARRATARTEQVRAITVDGTVAHESGASDSQELAVAVAAGVAYLRLLQRAGLTVAEALEQISFRIAATDDQFLSIAKFRAARVLWARVAEVAGAPDAGGAVIHAVTSEPMMAQRDPWVNMLRTTLAAFGAGVGGADSVRVRRFDDAIPGGLGAVSPAFAARIARNTQLLLIEESHVARVLDPGGGSWFIEDLTESLAQQAWSLFTEIEAGGGFEAATELIRERIAATRAQRADDIAHRRTSVTGVNEFPNLAGSRYRRILARVTGTPPTSRNCGTARMPSWHPPAPGRRHCCCRWDRWPNTMCAPRSRRTCWPPVVSKPSTPVRWTRVLSPTRWPMPEPVSPSSVAPMPGTRPRPALSSTRRRRPVSPTCISRDRRRLLPRSRRSPGRTGTSP